jgi:uncharacterized lipoprotein YmbA
LKSLCTAAGVFVLLAACASSRPDHFYTLTPLPQGALGARSAPAVQAALRLSVPVSVDRPQMVLNSSADGIDVMEHERWAAPLSDLMTQALARDIELRRTDLLVTGSGAYRANDPVVKLTVDVVQLSVRRGERASLVAHWRILDSAGGKDVTGGDEFSAALGRDDYGAVARALSECLGQLADRLVEQMR